MTRSKAGKRKVESEGESSRRVAKDSVSEACKKVLIKCIADFYESETTMSLQSKYVRYGEECIKKFKDDMWQRMMDLLHVSEWEVDMQKACFNNFLDSKVHDALWNAKDVLTKYGKLHRKNDEAFNDVILRAELFVGCCTPFASNRNRRGSLGWWNSAEGVELLNSRQQHLIALPETARVIHQDHKVLKGGYATIRRVRIEGCPGILPHWEFAAKVSNKQAKEPHLAKLEHQNESMAVRIQHPGVIRFVAVHAFKNEGYAYWWNGGTLRHMLHLDANYPDNIYIHLLHAKLTDEQRIEAFHLARFRKKRTELAWAFIHIMYRVHVGGHRHNDISPDNILLHFPQNESQVYIGICDWGMTTPATEEKKSLYHFTSAREMEDYMQKRWWVQPRLAYLHRAGADVGSIPTLSLQSEEYAVCKIAIQIHKESMSDAYYALHRETPNVTKFSFHDLALIFKGYMERVCNGDAGGLAHIINKFCDTYRWPIPNEHFRSSYD